MRVSGAEPTEKTSSDPARSAEGFGGAEVDCAPGDRLLAVGAAVWKIRKNAQEQAMQIQTDQAAGRPAGSSAGVAVQQKTMPIYLTQLGTVTAYNTVTIKSRVDGQLMTVPVREGQSGRQGTVAGARSIRSRTRLRWSRPRDNW